MWSCSSLSAVDSSKCMCIYCTWYRNACIILYICMHGSSGKKQNPSWDILQSFQNLFPVRMVYYNKNERVLSWSFFRLSQNVEIRICVKTRPLTSGPGREWLGGLLVGWKQWWRCSHAHILKSKLEFHQQCQLHRKFRLQSVEKC